MSIRMLAPFRGKKGHKGLYEKGNPVGQFDLIECLGEGTYGTVFTATEKKTNRLCAVKIVKIDDDLEEIEQEISIMKDSNSPFIVDFVGAFEADENKIWMVMEHCAAGSLNDLMYVCDRTFNVEQIRVACAAMALGLRYLHKNLVIHRDIKAGNVLLTAEGHLRLADFGVSAKLKKPTDRTNTAIGAPFWMAPEVIEEQYYDGRADIWSLGITVIELAEGRPPNSDLNPMKALFLIPQQEPPTLKQERLWPAEMVEFISICLTKKQKKRPNSTQILSYDFIRKEAVKLEKNNGRSELMRALVLSSLDLIKQWREKQNRGQGEGEDADGPDEAYEEDIERQEAEEAMRIQSVQQHQYSPQRERISVPTRQTEESNDNHSEFTEDDKMLLEPKTPGRNAQINSGVTPNAPPPNLHRLSNRSGAMNSPSYLNAARDSEARQSVRHSRKIAPLRDVVAPGTRISMDGRDGFTKADQGRMSINEVSNILNSDLPADSSQVQAAVMTKEFITLLKSIYRLNPEAFGNKPMKDWSGEDITIAVVTALQAVLEQGEENIKIPPPNAKNNPSSAKPMKAGGNGDDFDDDQFDEAAREQAELLEFVNLEFNPLVDGEQPPPPPQDEDN